METGEESAGSKNIESIQRDLYERFLKAKEEMQKHVKMRKRNSYGKSKDKPEEGTDTESK
jgi:hypothetical protein